MTTTTERLLSLAEDDQPLVAAARQLLADAVAPTVGREAEELTVDEVRRIRHAVLAADRLLADVLYSDTDPGPAADLGALFLQLAAQAHALRPVTCPPDVSTEVGVAVDVLARIDGTLRVADGNARYTRLHAATGLLHTTIRLHRQAAYDFAAHFHPEEAAGTGVRPHRQKIAGLSNGIELAADRTCIEIDRACR